MMARALIPAEVRRRVLAKPEPVQVVLRMLAVKMSEESAMDTDESIAAFVQGALEEWDETVMPQARLAIPGVTEQSVAEEVIARVRNEQPDGWGRILRGDAN